jgi:3-methyl-2-oxobutanoate hydroxymethyltransferase
MKRDNLAFKEKFSLFKPKSKPISMITCYDFPSAVLVEKASIDIALVGDSLGTNVLGYSSEKDVTISDMIHHTKAVSRGLETACLVTDLSHGSYFNKKSLLENSISLIKAGADAVKFEGFFPDYVLELTTHNIDVVCHLGLLPQTHEKKELQANSFESAKVLVEHALTLEKAGASMLILELVPEEITKIVVDLLTIPVIGIAAGRFCDGQVQIWHDVLGLSNKSYKHITNYADLDSVCFNALTTYVKDIASHKLLTSNQSFHITDSIVEDLKILFN